MRHQRKNIFDEIRYFGHDEDFQPNSHSSQACGARAGSIERLQVMRERLERGEDLWHPNDNTVARTPEEGLEAGTFCRAAYSARKERE